MSLRGEDDGKAMWLDDILTNGLQTDGEILLQINCRCSNVKQSVQFMIVAIGIVEPLSLSAPTIGRAFALEGVGDT